MVSNTLFISADCARLSAIEFRSLLPFVVVVVVVVVVVFLSISQSVLIFPFVLFFALCWRH